jgi:ubiquinone/menaquinone biosynthesis C-methylase UbiE
VDLGIGTGALAARCLAGLPEARIIGIDADGEMLEAAEFRLSGHVRLTLIHGDFLKLELPECDALVASFSLHHIPTPTQKQAFYRRCRDALTESGLLVSADCYPDRDPAHASRQREAWLEHLQRSYTREEAEGYLEAWAEEDVHFSLDEELAWLGEAGLVPEVLWRVDGFAVVAARAGPEGGG